MFNRFDLLLGKKNSPFLLIPKFPLLVRLVCSKSPIAESFSEITEFASKNIPSHFAITLNGLNGKKASQTAIVA